MKRLFAVLAGILIGWLAALSPADAVAPVPPVIAYGYNAPAMQTASVGAHVERGPPNETYDYTTVDRGSHGALARPDRATPSITMTYNAPTTFGEVARRTGTTRGQAQVADVALAVFDRGRVAANGGRTAARACSFAGSTTVLMADGSRKPIEDIEVGDKVIATDPETSEQVAKRVEHVFVHDDTVVDLVIDGEVITTTEDHPFWSVTDQRFERADDLASGEKVLGADGRVITVSGLHLGTAREALAYNLTVEGIHTYHVGESEILVHNTCPITGLNNGDHLPTGQALDKAEQFLGGGYTQARPGRYLSQDGLRQVRMTDADIAPRGGQLPHLNFETWASPVSSGGRNKLLDNLHIYLPEEFP